MCFPWTKTERHIIHYYDYILNEMYEKKKGESFKKIPFTNLWFLVKHFIFFNELYVFILYILMLTMCVRAFHVLVLNLILTSIFKSQKINISKNVKTIS